MKTYKNDPKTRRTTPKQEERPKNKKNVPKTKKTPQIHYVCKVGVVRAPPEELLRNYPRQCSAQEGRDVEWAGEVGNERVCQAVGVES